MKISTKTGDDGKTNLLVGGRIPKSSSCIIALGELDELSSTLGWCKASLSPDVISTISPGFLELLQKNLYRIMGLIGNGMQYPKNITPLTINDVDDLEKEMKKHEWSAGNLSEFILPGKNECSSRFHMARCICRRAERAFVGLYADLGQEKKQSSHIILKYLNRLSDLLFVIAHSFEVEI
jgi:cob(I)alamin adenosyltransferase